jgi:DNA-directed RNA polymerase
LADLTSSLQESFIQFVLQPSVSETKEVGVSSVRDKKRSVAADTILTGFSNSTSKLIPSPDNLQTVTDGASAADHAKGSTFSGIPFYQDWEKSKKERLSRASTRARIQREKRDQLTAFQIMNSDEPVLNNSSTDMVAETDIKLTLESEQELLASESATKKVPSSAPAHEKFSGSHYPPMSNELYSISVPYRLKSSAIVDALPEPERSKQNFEDQEFLEQLALEHAIQEYSKVTEQMFSLGKGSDMRPEQRIVSYWFNPLTAALKQDFAELANNPNLNSSVSSLKILQHIDVSKLSVLTLQALLNTLLSISETVLLRTVDVCTNLVENLKAELFATILRAENKPNGGKPHSQSSKAFHQLNEAELEREEYRPSALLRVAAHLIHRAIEVSAIPTVRPDGSTTMQTAFRLRIMITVYPSRIGVIQPHPGLLDLLRRSHVNSAGLGLKTLPMVTPPKDWSQVNRGAYLTQRQLVMRTHGHRSQLDVLKPADLGKVYEGLNCLNSVKWQINTKILDTIKHYWEEGNGFGEIPSLRDAEIPLRPDANESQQLFFKRRSRLIVNNRNLHSLRMSCKYRIEVAEMFRERFFYLPHSLDFRGRAYPLPPHLNQMGSDATRGLLLFAAPKALGTHGLYWLKVHLANLYGMDKLDFEGRVAWVDKNLENIEDSANAPITGRLWWQSADKPFECLAACHDLCGALKMANPEEFMSYLPTHQDGSCNGLQHYGILLVSISAHTHDLFMIRFSMFQLLSAEMSGVVLRST